MLSFTYQTERPGKRARSGVKIFERVWGEGFGGEGAVDLDGQGGRLSGEAESQFAGLGFAAAAAPG